jgi:stearoyl-CoA desaturase (delta-9 desaturase)
MANLVAVMAPFIGLVIAIVSLWNRGLSWADLCLLLGMYGLTVLGISVGFHRLFTHRAFETNVAVQFALGVLGSMAVQGPLLQWVATHRRHHQHSDRSEDPHSPHHHGRGAYGLFSGVWHAHIGWMFAPDPPNCSRYVADLRQSRLLCSVSALFPVWVLVGLLLPMIVGGLLAATWQGAWFGLVWGGLVRIFLVHHVTWSVNSVCHLWGDRPFQSQDHSRNNFLFGVLAFGEGWHNNHHAFPTSARHGLTWWQIDLSFWVIRVLALLGLAWNVRLACSDGRVPRKANVASVGNAMCRTVTD